MTTAPPLSDLTAPTATGMFRVEVRPGPGSAPGNAPGGRQIDPLGQSILADAQADMGNVTATQAATIFLIEASLSEQQIQDIAQQLLADPINQVAHIGTAAVGPATSMIEVHYQPGVMDPVAASTRDAIVEMLPHLAPQQVQVRTGKRYDLSHDPAEAFPSDQQLRSFAQRYLANSVIHDIHTKPFCPDQFLRGHEYQLQVKHVPIRDMDDHALANLSRQGHLFLSVPEMRAIRDYYRDAQREPTDIELETLAQTWSEHCVHKTFKSSINYSQPTDQHWTIPGLTADAITNRPGHTLNKDGSIHIDNLFNSTVRAATKKLMETSPHKQWCISVFADNAGIVRFDDEHGICIKVETHNHPSAIEPYGGAATGIGGCIRDIIGTGLAATPIANTDTFAVAPPQTKDLPKGVIAPKRILQQVVAGVRDYGNRMGIPTVDGGVVFHDDYLGNPLVFAGCVGLIPLDRCFGEAQDGDRIIVLGGSTGRDGIHGATFSSAELTDSHADEFSHAVQIGNPIMEKKTLDVILQARDWEGGPLFSAITDCGAGGFSSAVGEMGEDVGAKVNLEAAPLKYQGLSYTEIWISEAQERMVLAVPPGNVDELRKLCQAEDVPFCDLGNFGHRDDHGQAQLLLQYHATTVGNLPMALLHEGIPTPTRQATWPLPPAPQSTRSPVSQKTAMSLADALSALLGHPNIASKHWIIRQYDHEVQGTSTVKPLVGPFQDGPSDAAVLRPKLDSRQGIAISNGLAPHLAEKASQTGLADDGDSYWATLAAIDEAVRNAVCVGADPARIAILDNFCWPGCDDSAELAALVRAAEACYDGALAYRTPFVSGKDSLNNQFTKDDGQIITIPQTLLITAVGIVQDVRHCTTMDAKTPGNVLLIVGQTTAAMGGSHYHMVSDTNTADHCIPRVDLKVGPATAAAVADMIQQGLITSAHDCSDGGMLVAAAEMAFAGRVGLNLDLQGLPTSSPLDPITASFSETPSRYLLEVQGDQLDAVIKALRRTALPFGQIGQFAKHDRLTLRCPSAGQLLDVELTQLLTAWQKPLDW